MKRPRWFRLFLCSTFGHRIKKPFARGTVIRFYRCERCVKTLMKHDGYSLMLPCSDRDVMEVLAMKASLKRWRP